MDLVATLVLEFDVRIYTVSIYLSIYLSIYIYTLP